MPEFWDSWEDGGSDDASADDGSWDGGDSGWDTGNDGWDASNAWDTDPLAFDDDRLNLLGQYLFSDSGTAAPDELDSLDLLNDGSLRYSPAGDASLTDTPTFSADPDTTRQPFDLIQDDQPQPEPFQSLVPTVNLSLPTPDDAIALDNLPPIQPEPEAVPPPSPLEQIQQDSGFAQQLADEEAQATRARQEMFGYIDPAAPDDTQPSAPPVAPEPPPSDAVLTAGASTAIPSDVQGMVDNGVGFLNGLVAGATGMDQLNTMAYDAGTGFAQSIKDGTLLDAALASKDALGELFMEVARGDTSVQDVMQNVGEEAWNNIMAVWQSGNLTTAPIKDLASIETPLGSAGDMGALALGAQALARAPLPALVKGSAAAIAAGLTIARSPIVNDIVARMDRGESIDDAATQSALAAYDRLGDSTTRALRMVDEDWARVQPILNAVAKQDFTSARDLTRDIGSEQFDVYSARKEAGVDPGVMGEFLADFYGAPQLNVLFANPLVKGAVHGLVNTGQKAIGKIGQTPMGQGLIAGNAGANKAMAALVESGEKGVVNALFNEPDAAVGALKTRMHDLLSVTPHPPAFFSHTPSGTVAPATDAEAQMVQWMGSRISKDGSWPLLTVFDKAADSNAAKDPMAFVSRLRSDSISTVRNDVMAEFDDWMTKQRLVPQVMARAAGGSIRGAAKLFELPNRILAPLYLNTASYLYGNVLEAFARQALGNGRAGMMSEEGYKRYFPMFARHAPPSLLSDEAINTARRDAMPNPLISQKLFDGSNWVENGARRLYFVDRAQAHLDEVVKGARSDVRQLYNDVPKMLGKVLGKADPGQADEFIRSARMAALVGPDALDAVHQQALQGRFRSAAVDDLAKRWSDFPEIGQIIRNAAATGNPDVMAAARTQSLDALMHNVNIIADGRSKQVADELIPQFTKALDDGLAKFNPANAQHVSWLGGMADDLLHLQRMAQDHADNVHKADMLLNYYRNTTGPQRQSIARSAAAKGEAELGALHGQILPLVDKVGAQMNAAGMSGTTYVQKSREYVQLVREYHNALAEATTSAFDAMSKNQIRRKDLMDTISANKSAVDAKWSAILRTERDALDAAGKMPNGARTIKGAPTLSGSGLPKTLQPDVNRPELAVQTFDPSHAVISQKASNLQDAMLGMIKHHDDLWDKIDDVVAKDPMNDPTTKANLANMIGQIQARQSALPSVAKPLGVGLLDKAGQMAKDDYILNFPNYDQQNMLTYMAQLAIPFFRYEAFRWPYLIRTGLERPTLPFAYQDFWDRTDQGYMALPSMPAMEQLLSLGGMAPNAVSEAFGAGGFQFFPLGGTIASGIRGIARGDFPPNNALDKKAFEAATGKAGEPPSPQEKKWLQQPILRDLVAAKRLFDGTVGSASATVDSGDFEHWDPETRSLAGVMGQAKRIGERYGFYLSPTVGIPEAISKGTAGSVMGPVVNAIGGGLAVSPIPVVNDIAMNTLSRGFLRDDFRDNQVRHLLADEKIDPDRATSEQWDAAYKKAIQLEVFGEQIAGLRYRSPERVQSEEQRREVTDRVLSPAQRERLYQETGTSDMRESLKILNQQNRELTDIFDTPDLALDPDQRAAFGAIPGAQLRQKASEPFHDETGKALTNYYSYRQELYDSLEQDLTVRAGWLEQHKDDRGRPYTARDFVSDQRGGEARIAQSLKDLLEHNPSYEGVQEAIDSNRERRNVSLQDKLASEWFGLADQAMGSTGDVIGSKLSRLQGQWVQDKMGEADRLAFEMGDTSLRDALSDFMRARREKQDRYTPGYSEAKAINDQFYATTPRYRGVAAGSDKQDQIDSSLELYRRFIMNDPRGGDGVGDRALRRMSRDYPEDAVLARAYRKRTNPNFNTRRKQLMNANPVYKRYYGEEITDDGRTAAAIQAAIQTKPSLDDLISRATFQSY